MTLSFKTVFIALFLLLSRYHSYASDNNYTLLKNKALRFMQYKEWDSASAMYELMIDQQPKVIDNYVRAIVVAGMQGNAEAQMSLMERSQRNLIPLDSIFSGVKTESFALGQSKLYEHFLLIVKERQPWLKRNLEKQLLNYYIFRRDAKRIVKYSKIMLSGAKTNSQFLSYLALGYMLSGEYAEAMDVYKRIVDLYPDNVDALLELGNYYLMQGNDAQARIYLEQAYKINPTPYVAKLLGLDRHHN